MGESTTPVLAGLAIGIGFFGILSIATNYGNPVPPDMIILLEGKQHEAGIGSYGGRHLFGGGYGVDVDDSRTLPEDTFNATVGSKMQFIVPSSFTRPMFSEQWVWILDVTSQNQYFLEKVDDSSFQIPSDVPTGDYVLSIRATYDNGIVSSAFHVHKIRIL